VYGIFKGSDGSLKTKVNQIKGNLFDLVADAMVDGVSAECY
jgi:hypothetical protein